MRKHCIFVDLLLMVSYVQSTLQKELFKICIFVEFLLMVSYVQGTLRKELLIVSFVEHFKTTKYFRKASLIPFIDTLNKILKHCLFTDFLLIVSYGQGVLQKEQGAAF